MPPEQQNNVPVTTTPPNTSGGLPPGYQPSKEEIERTMKIMHSSVSRKKKGFLDTLKDWFS